MKFRVWPETLKQITISTIPVRLIHLHAVLKNTQLPCHCDLGKGWSSTGLEKCRVCSLRNFFFSFFGSQRVKNISATKTTIFRCFVFLAHSDSLWLFPDYSASFRLTLALSLACSGAHRLTRSLLGSLRRSCVSNPALEQ